MRPGNSGLMTEKENCAGEPHEGIKQRTPSYDVTEHGKHQDTR